MEPRISFTFLMCFMKCSLNLGQVFSFLWIHLHSLHASFSTLACAMIAQARFTTCTLEIRELSYSTHSTPFSIS